jgi:Ca2+-binding EF-hand superfamily protein
MRSLLRMLGLSVLVTFGGAGLTAAQEQAAGAAGLTPGHPQGGPGPRARRAANFEKLDTNRDGKLTFEEFNPPHVGSRTLPFEKMDADHDGELTLEQFKAFHLELRRASFESRDPDGDGALGGLSPRDPQQEPTRGARRGARGNERLDTNHDGKVTFEEYSAPHVKVRTTTFKKMDANRDGKLSAQEYESYFQRHRRLLFDGRDVNGDGELSQGEFVNLRGIRALRRPRGTRAPGGQRSDPAPPAPGASEP